MRALANFSIALLYSALALLRNRGDQAIVELALRQQLSVYARVQPRPWLSSFDRGSWVALSSLWPRWKEHLVLIRPETVVRWHRQGFRRYWRSISTPGPGRPPISKETRTLIVQMATENSWGTRKIQAELSKLGISVGIDTVSRYIPNIMPDPSRQQRWIAFLRNHREVITGMDIFVAPTVRFRLLYVWFAIDHGRRQILYFNVTENPTACRVIQQLREAFPEEPIHRFVIYDNGSIFSFAVTHAIKSLGMDPKRTARSGAYSRTGPQCVWLKVFAARFSTTWSSLARPTSDGFFESTSTTTTRNVFTPRLPMHRSVGFWIDGPLSTPGSSECRALAVSTTATAGAKRPDR